MKGCCVGSVMEPIPSRDPQFLAGVRFAEQEARTLLWGAFADHLAAQLRHAEHEGVS